MPNEPNNPGQGGQQPKPTDRPGQGGQDRPGGGTQK